MPSAHSQFVFFAIIFWSLLLLKKWKNQDKITVFCSVSGLWILGCGCVIGRVYLEYHTIPQVIVGVMIGSIIGCIWYILYTFISKYLSQLENIPILKSIGICHSESLREKGWNRRKASTEISQQLRNKKIN